MPKFVKGQSGNPAGKPKGAKDKRPRGLRRMLEHIHATHPDDLEARFLKGLLGRESRFFFAIDAGLEKQQVELTGEDGGPVRVEFVDA